MTQKTKVQVEIKFIDPQAVAERFAKVLRSWLTKSQMAKVIKLNLAEQARRKSLCHSHDFCDANMAMLEAVEAQAGRDVDVNEEGVFDLMNAAWNLAQEAHFFQPRQVKFNRHNVTDGVFTARIFYSLDSRTDRASVVTIYAKDYDGTLGRIFTDGTYKNETCIQSDYFDKGHVSLFVAHPLYKEARERAEAIEMERKVKREGTAR